MHYENKVSALRRMTNALKPGGWIVVTDYCRRDKFLYTQDFVEYAEEWDYYLITVNDHKALMERVGFGFVQALDETEEYMETLAKDIEAFKANRDKILSPGTLYKEADFVHLLKEWKEKLRRCKIDDQNLVTF